MPLPRRAFISLSLAFLPCLAGSSALAAWSQMLAGRVERVAVAGDHVVAVRGDTVILLREDGTLLRQMEAFSTPPRRRPERPNTRAGEDILDLLGIDESEEDNAWAVDEIDNESTLGERRTTREGHAARAASPSHGAPAIAAGEEEVWIATRGGLWHVPVDGDLVQVAGGDLAGSLLAVGLDHQLLLASGKRLWLVSGPRGPRQLLATLAAQPTSLSASRQRLAWATRTQVRLSENRDEIESQALAVREPVIDLRFCGEALLLLSRNGLAVLSPEGLPETRAPHLSARHVWCPADGGDPWLASGPDLLLSHDQGRTWSSLPVPARTRALDAAIGKRGLWLATDHGLYCASDEVLFRPAQNQPEASTSAATPESTRSPRRFGPREAAWWAGWLPRLTVRAGATVASGRREIQTVALASFPLDAPLVRAPPVLVADNDDSVVPPISRSTDLNTPPDSEADCLPLTRARAVALAMVEPDRGRSYVSRAHHAAWLPELRFRVDRRLGRSESLDLPSTSTAITSPLGVDTVDDVRYEARVTWDLARLVFSNDELAAQAQTMHMAETRRDIEITVSRLYFERRRLRLERMPAGERAVAWRRELRVREIESELDALSGGAFSQCTDGRTSAQGAL
jgi:hypothetical protein